MTHAWGGGMVVTCGLDHTLVPGEDTAGHFNQPHIRKTVRYSAPPGMTAIGEFEARVSRLAAPRAAGAPGESPSDQKAVNTR